MPDSTSGKPEESQRELSNAATVSPVSPKAFEPRTGFEATSSPGLNATSVSPAGSGASDSVAATAELAPPPIPKIDLERYLLNKFHARGGMGEIWLFEDARIGREVAVKKLTAGGEHARARFIAEAQVTGRLEHPGIVPVHDLGEDGDGRPYYVMKFLRGRTLKQAIAEYHSGTADAGARELQRQQLLGVFLDLCNAIAYAHSRGVLHRDIKPDNVMLGTYGETMVLDWGLAKVRGQPDMGTGESGVYSGSVSGSISRGSVTSETLDGSVMGSLPYMPPEMCEGKIGEVDERSDIFLLGATLYEILTGRPPREGRTRDEMMELARNPISPRPRKIKPEVPKSLDGICAKAMACPRDERYPTALELAKDVQRYLADEPVSAYRETFRERAWRWARRHWKLIRSITVAVLVLAAFAMAWAQYGKLKARERESQREAALLRDREAERAQIRTFDSLLDEARYYGANTDPVAENAPYYDQNRARESAEAALAAADAWGPSLQSLQLSEEAPRLRAQLYELLLLMAQDAGNPEKESSGREVKALLDRAASLTSTLSRSYYRLRAADLQANNDPAAVADMERRVSDPLTPALAFDFFLEGERLRRQTAEVPESPTSTSFAEPARLATLNKSLDAFRHAVQQDPTHYWSHFQLGRCYLGLGKLPEAVEALGTCIALRHQAPWGYSARGIALTMLKRYGDARQDLDRAIELDPEFRPARLNRGSMYWLQKDRGAALADFTAVLRPPDKSRLVEAAYYRAQIFVESAEYDRAIDDLTLLINNKKDFYPAYLLRARVHLLAGQPSASMEDLDVLANHGTPQSGSSESFGRRGRLLRRLSAQLQGKVAQTTLKMSREDLERAIRLGARTAAVHADLGAVQELLGQTEAAVASYAEALRLKPSDIDVRIERAWACEKLGRLLEAQQEFLEVTRIEPISAEAYGGLGYIHAREHDYDEAKAAGTRSLLYGANDYLILHNIACIYGEMSKTDVAHVREHQDLAITMLQRSLEVWRRSRGTGPDELQLINDEPAFGTALRSRPEFSTLLRN